MRDLTEDEVRVTYFANRERFGYPPKMKKIDGFYRALGRFVLNWSDMELCLDLLVITCCQDRKDDWGHTIAHKLKLLDESNPTQHAVDLKKLVKEIRAVVDNRHDYVHGAAVDMFEKERPSAVSLGRMLQPTKKTRRKPVTVSTAALNKAANDTFSLGTRALDLAELLNRQDLAS